MRSARAPAREVAPVTSPPTPEELARWVELYGDPEDWAKRAQAAHARAERLHMKLSQAAATIGLQPGGDSDGYLIPNLEQLVDDRDRFKRQSRELDAKVAEQQETNRELRDQLDVLAHQVQLLRAGARDIAHGDYANAPARAFAHRMLNDTKGT